jgi:hypothetical protein
MSAYFIIPNSFTGTGDKTVYFDKGVNIQVKRSERTSNFGDNYFSTIQLGPVIKTYSTSLSNRPVEDIDLVESYFNFLEGALINGLHIDTSINGVVEQFNKNYANGELYSISFQIRQVFR